MEEDMEMEIEPVFEAYEIDLDYEFEAARFFDFTREETCVEAHQAELWFESAKSYPPSPFAAKMLLREETLQENDSNPLKSEETESPAALLYDDRNAQMPSVLSAVDSNNTGLMLYNKISTNKPNAEIKSAAKPSFHRSSTLMKPTASLLAKQNHSRQLGSRFKGSTVQNKDKGLCNSSGMETQAPKRQKLEGGHLRKVAVANQPTNLVHKEPKKAKITVPREPDLETAHRAQRIRSRSNAELKHASSTVRHFRARPLNRKILEGPSLPFPKKSTPMLPEFRVFHLKTQERALQHSSASSTDCSGSDKGDNANNESIVGNCYGEPKRKDTMDGQKSDGCDMLHKFKARPVNRKIFASKGDLGVFRNSKKDTTVPMEFNLHSEKRNQHSLPIELFSKLSLKPELQPNNGSQPNMPPPTSISQKGSKENRMQSFQPQNEILHAIKDKPPTFFASPIQQAVDGCIIESGNYLSPRNLVR